MPEIAYIYCKTSLSFTIKFQSWRKIMKNSLTECEKLFLLAFRSISQIRRQEILISGMNKNSSNTLKNTLRLKCIFSVFFHCIFLLFFYCFSENEKAFFYLLHMFSINLRFALEWLFALNNTFSTKPLHNFPNNFSPSLFSQAGRRWFMAEKSTNICGTGINFFPFASEKTAFYCSKCTSDFFKPLRLVGKYVKEKLPLQMVSTISNKVEGETHSTIFFCIRMTQFHRMSTISKYLHINFQNIGYISISANYDIYGNFLIKNSMWKYDWSRLKRFALDAGFFTSESFNVRENLTKFVYTDAVCFISVALVLTHNLFVCLPTLP